jgi:hypothetical protein
LLSAACIPPGSATSSKSAAAARDDDLPFLSTEDAEKRGLVGEPLRIDLDATQDGTKMLVGALTYAKKRGAVGVSEVSVVLPGEKEGVECRSSIHSEATTEERVVPGHTTLVPVTKPVTRMVTQSRQVCRLESKPYTEMQTTYTTQYDSISKTTRSVPQQRMVSKTRFENVCRYEPYTSMQTFYEYQSEQRYTPPSTEYLKSRKLVTSEPLCYEAEGTITRRLEGTLWRRAKVEKRDTGTSTP